jgi:predicted Zn-dependent protease
MANITLARKYWDKAFDYYFKGQPSRAIAAGRKAMELNPAYVRPHWIIGQAFLHGKKPDRELAIREFRQLIEKEPRWAPGHVALARVLMQQGRFAEALKSYSEALRLNPQQLGVRIPLAQLWLKRNDYHEAIRVLRGIDSPFRTSIDAYLLLTRAMAEDFVHYGRAEMRAAWEHILTFDESIPANRAAIAEARQELEKLRPENLFPKRET